MGALRLAALEAVYLVTTDNSRECSRYNRLLHENRAECLFSLLKPYLRVFRGVSKYNLPGYVGFFQFPPGRWPARGTGGGCVA